MTWCLRSTKPCYLYNYLKDSMRGHQNICWGSNHVPWCIKLQGARIKKSGSTVYQNYLCNKSIQCPYLPWWRLYVFVFSLSLSVISLPRLTVFTRIWVPCILIAWFTDRLSSIKPGTWMYNSCQITALAYETWACKYRPYLPGLTLHQNMHAAFHQGLYCLEAYFEILFAKIKHSSETKLY